MGWLKRVGRRMGRAFGFGRGKGRGSIPAPSHAPAPNSPDAEAYPRPRWWVDGLNWAVVGNSGAGKSTFVNFWRDLKPGDPGAANVGIVQQHVIRNADGSVTILDPQPYLLPDNPILRLWDVPGCGTPDIPTVGYIGRFGLRYMTGLIIITATRLTDAEKRLILDAEEHRIPWYVIRSKIDFDIANNKRDNDIKADDTKEAIRREFTDSMKQANPRLHAATRFFLVSCVSSKTAQQHSEWDRLASCLSQDLAVAYPNHIKDGKWAYDDDDDDDDDDAKDDSEKPTPSSSSSSASSASSSSSSSPSSVIISPSP